VGHDPEAAEPTCSETAPPFTNLNARDPGSAQNSKGGLRSTHNRTRSVTAPHPVYPPFQRGISHASYGTGSARQSGYSDMRGRQRERSRSLSSLSSLPCPLYRPDAGLSSSFIEQDLYPPPEYSSPPGSPFKPTATQASTTPIGDMTAPFPEVGGIDNDNPHASLIPTTFSCPNISSEMYLPAEWKDIPHSASRPTIGEIPSTLNRTLSSPERYTANIGSKVGSHETYTTQPYEDCIVFFDHHAGRIIPRMPVPSDQITPSDSIVTIRPCDMVATAADLLHNEFLPSHSDDNLACKDSCHAITALASEYVGSDGTPQTADFDEDNQEPKLTHIPHEASRNGTDSMEISS
jgi:hypothetical protein